MFFSTDLHVGDEGLLAASEVLYAEGAGRVFLVDAASLCEGAVGAADVLAATILEGSEPGSWFGSNSRWLDDLDGDGRQDLVVSAPSAAGGGAARGAVFVWFGTPSETLSADSADLILYGSEDGSSLRGSPPPRTRAATAGHG